MTKLTHIVFFWLKRPDAEEDRRMLVEGLESLSAIPEVRSLATGFPADTAHRPEVDGTWSVSEVMTFDNEADEAVYQAHPIHLAFIEKCGHLWDRVAVYDITSRD